MTQTDDSQTAKLRTLIADDIQETRRNTRLMLSSLNNVEVVAIASNGRQAVEMTKEHRPDIVILDVNMPELDGLAAFTQIIQMYPDTGCIVISAENSAEKMGEAAAIGIKEYLVKPFIIEELESAIKRVSERLHETRAKIASSNQTLAPNVALEELAHEYMKEGRTDDEATQIFERLAENPQCAARWLETLALMYAIRQEWGKLTTLAARLERETNR